MTRSIYEAQGRAKEYAFWALNLYKGCTHGCKYCYVPMILHTERDEFHSPEQAVPRDGILQQLRIDAERYAGLDIRVLLCFTCDPYQPWAWPSLTGAEAESFVTRDALNILRRNEIPFQVLTKGGLRAVRDFDMYSSRDAFAVTLTCVEDDQARRIEPLAAPTSERIRALEVAHSKGIFTWVSLEPVINTAESLQLIEMSSHCCDHYKIGPLNYSATADKPPGLGSDEMRRFAISAIKLCEENGRTIWIKQELARHLGGVLWEQADTRRTMITKRRRMWSYA